MQLISERRRENLRRSWFNFSKNRFSVIGLVVVLAVVFVALFAPYVAPYPQHAGLFVDTDNAHQPPEWNHLFGTDEAGRDILSRVFFAFRYSLMMAAVVLALVVPLGVVLGLTAGYFKGTYVENVIMRVTDIFLGVPPLVLALAICAVLSPNIFNAMAAVSVMWWPWYSRLVYSTASSIRNESFIQAAEVTGNSTSHILFREILPNCLPSILTKTTLDVGWVILIGASLSFVGLGAQPPTPDLGTMVATGARFMPTQWWECILPAVSIAIIILGFNLLGDGVRDIYVAEA